MEETSKKIINYKNILSSTKLSLIFNNILISILENKNNNGKFIQENIDPLTKLISNYEEIEKLWNIKEEYIIKLFYFNKKMIHKILYDKEEIIFVESFEIKKPLTFYFYLDLLIKDNTTVVNYSYLIGFINKINMMKNNIDKEKIYEKIIISKIIIDLINNYKETDNYNKEEEIIINKIVEENEFIIKNNIGFLPNNVNELLFSKNLDEIYIEILNELINQEKFDGCEELIKNELDLENINITKNMFEKLSIILNKNEYYILNSYEDLNNEKKINFYYILFKYILKEPLYIYIT